MANQAGSGKAGGKANTAAVPSPDVAGPSQDELRQKRLAFFNQKPPPPASTNGETSANGLFLFNANTINSLSSEQEDIVF